MAAMAAIKGSWLALGILGILGVPVAYGLYRWTGGRCSLRQFIRDLL